MVSVESLWFLWNPYGFRGIPMVSANEGCYCIDINLYQNVSLPVKQILTTWRRKFLGVSFLFRHFAVSFFFSNLSHGIHVPDGESF